MSMTLAGIRSEVRVLLAEKTSSASFFVDTDLNFFINQAIHDICLAGLVFEKVANLTVVAGTASYSLETDHIRTAAVIDVNGKALTPINYADLGRGFTVSATNTV